MFNTSGCDPKNSGSSLPLVRRPFFSIRNDLEIRRKAQIIQLDLCDIDRSRCPNQQSREAPRQRGLAHAFWTGEQQRLRYASAGSHSVRAVTAAALPKKLSKTQKYHFDMIH